MTIQQHVRELKGTESDVFVYGQEKTLETVNLAKMNLAVNGLRGQVMKANTYYDDPYDSFGAFDYVLANPPFNVDDVKRGLEFVHRAGNSCSEGSRGPLFM